MERPVRHGARYIYGSPGDSEVSKPGLLRALGVAALLTTASGLSPAHAESGSFAEYEVKAAMLFNFARFVDWPAQTFPNDRTPLVIGILGTDPFGKIIDEVFRDRTLGTRPISVRRIRNPGDTEGCHVLFIARSERGRLAGVLAGLKNTPVLTVSDMDAFVRSGGMIELTMEASRVRFEVNQFSARHAGLSISSRLLKLASGVRSEGGAQP